MGSQKTKMGRLKRPLIIVGNIFVVIFMTSVSIFCMEPEIITRKIPMSPTEAFADIGKYLAICLTFFAIARLMLGKNIKPGCEKLFVDLDKRIKETDSKVGIFMLNMATQFATLNERYTALDKTVNGLVTRIDYLINNHLKK